MNKTEEFDLRVKDKLREKSALGNFKLPQDTCDELQQQILHNNSTMLNLDATNKRLTNQKVQLDSNLNALRNKKELLVQEIPQLKARLEEKQTQLEEEEKEDQILSRAMSDLEQTVNQSNSESLKKEYKKLADKFQHIVDSKEFAKQEIAQLNTEFVQANLQNQLAQQAIDELEVRNQKLEYDINIIKSQYEEASNNTLKFSEMLAENIERRLCTTETNRQNEDTFQDINQITEYNNTWWSPSYQNEVNNVTSMVNIDNEIDWENHSNNSTTNRGTSKINATLLSSVIFGIGIGIILVAAGYYFIKKYFFSQSYCLNEQNNNSENPENNYMEIEEKEGYLLPTHVHQNTEAIPLIARTSKGLFIAKERDVANNTIVNTNEMHHYHYPRGCRSVTEDDINNEAAYVNCLGVDTAST